MVLAALAFAGAVALPMAAGAQETAKETYTFRDTDAASEASKEASARIAELAARHASEEAACMSKFFANACAKQSRRAYLDQKAVYDNLRQQAEYYLRADAEQQRQARVSERLTQAEAELRERQSSAAAKPPAAPAQPAVPPSPSAQPPGTSPLTDLGAMPAAPNASAKPAPVINPLPERKPDDPAQRAENRKDYERRQQEAREYAERHAEQSKAAAERRERRRAEREAERLRLEGASPAAPAAQQP